MLYNNLDLDKMKIKLFNWYLELNLQERRITDN